MSRCRCHVAVLLAALAIPLSVAGCGGSGKATASGSAAGAPASVQPAPSGQPQVDAGSARLIASADVICKRINGQLSGAPRSQPSEIARTAPRNAAIELRAVDELSKLTPPPSIAGDWAQILAYRRTLAQELLAVAKDAKSGDVAGMRALGVSKKKVRKKLEQLAARDGFKDCTSVGTVNVATLFPTLHPAAGAHPGG